MRRLPPHSTICAIQSHRCAVQHTSPFSLFIHLLTFLPRTDSRDVQKGTVSNRASELFCSRKWRVEGESILEPGLGPSAFSFPRHFDVLLSKSVKCSRLRTDALRTQLTVRNSVRSSGSVKWSGELIRCGCPVSLFDRCRRSGLFEIRGTGELRCPIHVPSVAARVFADPSEEESSNQSCCA